MKLADFSPAVAMATGEGAMGKAMRQGFGGLLPMAIAKEGYKDEEEAKRAEVAAKAQGGMKKGGVVKAKSKASSASRRADGIASKGKTKGRMI